MSSRGSAAEVGTDDLPVCADLGGGSSGEFAAEIQHGDAVADVEDQVRMMLDQQDAAAGLPDRLDERPKARDLVGGEAGRRFVEEQEGRAQHERAGDLHEAELAVL